MDAGTQSEAADTQVLDLLDVVAEVAGTVRQPFFTKTRPATEGDERFVYCEPSDPNPDTVGDTVLPEAILKASPGFLKHGIVDLNHFTILGPKMGWEYERYSKYELGHPVELNPSSLVLKCSIRRGEGKRFDIPNEFWEDLNAGKRFFPSIAGNYLDRQCGEAGCIVKSIDWTSVAFAATPFVPVNRTVKAVSLSPLDFAKALMAGHGTDHAALTGADALRRESLGGKTLKIEQDGDDTGLDAPIARYIGSLGRGTCAHVKGDQTYDKICDHFENCEGMKPLGARRALRRLGQLVSHSFSKTNDMHVAKAA